MKNVFTENEIKILKEWLDDKPNKEIAEMLNVSEAYVSQTIDKIEIKMQTLDNSVNFLEEIGIIESPKSIKVSEQDLILSAVQGKFTKSKMLELRKKMPTIFKDTVVPSNNSPEPIIFTANELRSAIRNLISALLDPKLDQSPYTISQKTGIPINIIEESRYLVNQIQTHKLTSTPNITYIGGQINPLIAFFESQRVTSPTTSWTAIPSRSIANPTSRPIYRKPVERYSNLQLIGADEHITENFHSESDVKINTAYDFWINESLALHEHTSATEKSRMLKREGLENCV